MRLVVPCSLALAVSASAGVVVEPPALPTVAVSASATSSARGHEPWYALSSDPTKLWCEGKSDEGIGEALVLKLAAPIQIESITIRAGVWRSPELFRANNRITELDVITDDGRTKKVTLREEREDVDVPIGRGEVRELRLQIAAIAKGGKANDTCISGIDLHTSPASQVAVVADAAATPALEPAFAGAWRALASCDEAGLRAQLKFPFAVAHTRYADAKSARKACKDGAFVAYITSGDPPRVKPETPGKLMIIAGSLEWHYVLDGKAWRLVSLVDQAR